MRVRRMLLVPAVLAGAIAAAAAAPVSRPNQPTADSWMQDNTSLPPGVNSWAVVNSDGTLARGLHARKVVHSQTGYYTVYFGSNIAQCAYTATIGLSGYVGYPAPGFVTVIRAAASRRAVFVSTYDDTGAVADEGFHLAVSCHND
jgi:hypothetical protein